jgi:hypothetical protein
VSKDTWTKAEIGDVWPKLTQHEGYEALLLVLFESRSYGLPRQRKVVFGIRRERFPLETQDLGCLYARDVEISARMKSRVRPSDSDLDTDTMRLRASVHDQLGMIPIPHIIVDVRICIINPRPELVSLDGGELFIVTWM